MHEKPISRLQLSPLWGAETGQLILGVGPLVNIGYSGLIDSWLLGNGRFLSLFFRNRRQRNTEVTRISYKIFLRNK